MFFKTEHNYNEEFFNQYLYFTCNRNDYILKNYFNGRITDSTAIENFQSSLEYFG